MSGINHDLRDYCAAHPELDEVFVDAPLYVAEAFDRHASVRWELVRWPDGGEPTLFMVLETSLEPGQAALCQGALECSWWLEVMQRHPNVAMSVEFA